MKVWDFRKTEKDALNFYTTELENEGLNDFKVNQKYNFVDPDSGVKTLKGFGVAKDGE